MNSGSFDSSFSTDRIDASNSGSVVSLSTSYSMFPIVEKTYRPSISKEVERELRYLGQSRLDALAGYAEMTLIKDKKNLQIYEACCNEVYTIKGVTTVNAPLVQVMQMLRMEDSDRMRDVMGKIFGTLFLDGVVLYRAKEDPSRVNESMTVNWMALQSAKPNLPHRDYLFLRYGDVMEKMDECESASRTGLYVGASVWESIQLDGCAPLPASQNVVRLRMRRCGIVAEELNEEKSLRISLYISEGHPGRATVSTLTRSWMTKMVSCVTEISNTLIARALVSQTILSKKQFKDGFACCQCQKPFSMIRRKHHCRICGDVVCSRCSELKNLKQGGMNKELRICANCYRNGSAIVPNYGDPSYYEHQKVSMSSSVSSSLSFTGIGDVRSGSDEVLKKKYYDKIENDRGGVPDERHNGKIPSQRTRSRSSREHVPDAPVRRREISRSADTPTIEREMAILSVQNKNAVSQSEGNGGSFTYYNQYKSKRATKDWPGSLTSMGTDTGYSSIDSTLSLTDDEMIAVELASTVRENTRFTYALSYTSRQEWPKAPIPKNEADRLTKVRQLYLGDPGHHFHEMCEYAVAETSCQVAAICLIGDRTGFLMAKVGIEKAEVPRNVLFDSHTIMSDEPMIVLDTNEDVRFAKNPLVKSGQIRFYAGFPLITSDGFVVGCLSIADEFPRECLSGDKYFFLKSLADVTIRGIEQNTLHHGTMAPADAAGSTDIQLSDPPEMNLLEAQSTMRELLKTAYSTQCQVRMQANPVDR
ncbi:unnamed protein product [Albugo candida]|uniref:FYVE-type domain-containing protein n=1 Tax=Albugo candida TaxID=65357 RepID=A0A024GC55_9STRA|nr:unnamed protein product [Albugo candida]|eukprot:CCI44135.1 unnamed protein product [Albugo candida]